MLAFSDGAKPGGFPKLVPRPIAFFLFTLVINREAGVEDLSLQQIRRLYAGEMTNWREVGGNNLPVRLVGRQDSSGTRGTFQRRILGGKREPGVTSQDCLERDPGSSGKVIRCERDSTGELLNTVADTPGALGYSELGAASGHANVLRVSIDGQPVAGAGEGEDLQRAALDAAEHGAYPFWETEYAYTYGQPQSDSLVESFLRFLTNQEGQDIVRDHGDRPCADLENPALCRPRPTRTTGR